MAGRVYVKDPTTTIVTLGPVIINGFADGDAISSEPIVEEETVVTGVDGDVVRLISASKAVAITIRLMEGSPANLLLERIKLLRTPITPRGDQVPFTMTDFGSGKIWTSPQAWVSNSSLPQLGSDAPVEEWIIRCAYLTRVNL
jgi:hypothetical protein